MPIFLLIKLKNFYLKILFNSSFYHVQFKLINFLMVMIIFQVCHVHNFFIIIHLQLTILNNF